MILLLQVLCVSADTLSCKDVRSQYLSNECCTTSDKNITVGEHSQDEEAVRAAYMKYHIAFGEADYEQIARSWTKTGYYAGIKLGENGVMGVADWFRVVRGPFINDNYVESKVNDLRVFGWNSRPSIYAQVWVSFTRYNTSNLPYYTDSTWHMFMMEDEEWKVHML